MSPKPVKRASAQKQKKTREIIVISGVDLEDGLSAIGFAGGNKYFRSQYYAVPYERFELLERLGKRLDEVGRNNNEAASTVMREHIKKTKGAKFQTLKALQAVLGEKPTDVSMDPGGTFYILHSEQMVMVRERCKVKTINFEELVEMDKHLGQRIAEVKEWFEQQRNPASRKRYILSPMIG